MLKRRCPSPTPIVPTFLDLSSQPLDDSRCRKRRRIPPDELEEPNDGNSSPAIRLHRSFEDPATAKRVRQEPEDSTHTALDCSPDDNRYKTTNSLLHELHVLQRHRLAFQFSPGDQIPWLNKHHTASVDTSCRLEAVDALHVTSYYEDWNRFLGELFLSRKRQLDQSSGRNS